MTCPKCGQNAGARTTCPFCGSAMVKEEAQANPVFEASETSSQDSATTEVVETNAIPEVDEDDDTPDKAG